MNKEASYLSNENVVSGLAKSSFIYAISKIFNIVLGFVSFGLLARNFSPVEFGKLDFLFTIIIFIGNTAIFGQDQALGRLINEPIDDKERLKIANHGFLIQIVYSIFLTLLVFTLYNWLIPSENIISSSYPSLTFSISLIQIPFFVILYAGLGLLQWSSSKKSYALLSVLSYLIPTVLLFALIRNHDLSITQVLLLYLVSRFIIAVLTIIFCLRKSFLNKIFSIDLNLVKKLIIFAIPLGLVVTFETFAPLLQRYLVKSILSDYDLGLFALAYKIASVILILSSAFSTAWGPIFLNSYKDLNAKISFILVFKIFVVISSIGIVFLSVFSSNFINILGSTEYQAAKNLILPLSLGISIEILNDITGIGFFIYKKNYFYTYSFLLFIFAFTLIFLLLSPIYGYLSIGYSIFLSYLIKNVFITILSNKLYFVNWPYKIAFFSYSISFLISSLANQYTTSAILISKFALLILGLFLLLTIFFQSLSQKEIKIFRKTTKSFTKELKRFIN